MTKVILNFSILFLLITNVYSQDRHQEDSISANKLISKEIISLESKGISKNDILSFYDDSGKIVIAWQTDKKVKAVKMYYKGGKCDKAKRQRLSKLDKQSLNTIFNNPNILTKISSSNCDERVNSFNRVNFKIGTFENIILSHCKQDEEVKPLLTLYFNLRE